MAENSIFLFISNILAHFSIKPLEKEHGGLASIEEAYFRPYLVQSVFQATDHEEYTLMPACFHSY